MSNEVAVVFTAKSIQRILNEGGTSSWRLDRNHARRCPYVVCTRNANADWVEGPEDHQSAFLIGKIKDVVPAPDYVGRFLILFSEYAQVKISDVWQGDRNPIKYTTLDALGIDPTTLSWQPMPEVEVLPAPIAPHMPYIAGEPLTITRAKAGLALTFGISPDMIEITIRG